MRAEREVYLVRHGDVENPRGVLYGRLPGFGLSHEGRLKIGQLADKFKKSGIEISKIYSSPLARTVQSAEIIGRVLQVPVEINQSLNEVECKFLEGKTKREQLAIYLLHGFNLYSAYYIRKGIEAKEKVALRMKSFVGMHMAQRDGNFIVVSHGDPLIFLLWAHLYEVKTLPKTSVPANNKNYLKKGEAMVLNFDSDDNFSGFKRF